ncbi:MAG: ROK family protein [Kurthia sp.]|nr:ROK family protein [Candidatus Kurthia equi]
MSWNQQTGKKFNKEIILQQVFLNQTISRNELIENTQLKKATVANLVNELIEEQFIIEAGKEESTGGRRPNLLKLNAQAGYALSIDIGVNYLSGVITNLNGEIIWKVKEFILDTTLEKYLEKIITLIHLLEQHVPPSPYHIVGLAISVPGLIDTNGIILKASNLQWHDVDIRTLLQPYVTYPTIISNEANAGAFGEYSYTYNQQHQNLLFVSIGYGIGVGTMMNGELFLGDQGFSGESGHMIIQMDGKTCRCGRAGCWEAYASESALVKEVETEFTMEHVTIEDILEMTYTDDKLTPLLTNFSKYIGIGLMNLIYTFNPSKIIIGNRITLLQDQLEKPIRAYVNDKSSSFFKEDVNIEFSTLDDNAILIGAASLAINQFLLPALGQ